MDDMCFDKDNANNPDDDKKGIGCSGCGWQAIIFQTLYSQYLDNGLGGYQKYGYQDGLRKFRGAPQKEEGID